MNNRYQNSSIASTVAAMAFALVVSTTFVLSAIAPAVVQSGTAQSALASLVA